MLKNYFKVAWRYLKKNPFYSFINISGLTVGLTVGILILLWVQDEYGYDDFHRQQKDIYRLENWAGTGSSRQIWTETVAPIGMLAKKDIPGVRDFTRISDNSTYSQFIYKDKIFNELRVAFTDPSLFTMFDFKLIKGNNAAPFPDNHSIVLTETTARNFFGEEDPMGKIIETDNKASFKVTGIIKDIPQNSSIRQEIFLPMTMLNNIMYAGNDKGESMANDFRQFSYETFLLLQPGISLKNLSVTLRNIHLKNKSDDVDVDYLLQPLDQMHLYQADGSDGGIETVRMFTLIAIVILVIACINYVNLSTARSMLRAKEVSIRKIAGAARRQLFLQFVIETALTFILASVLALGLVHLLLPAFNNISGKELVIDLSGFHIWKIIFITISGTLLLSSIYPALLLSSFEPVKALKGKASAHFSDAVFRKVLVVTQFVFSIVLITGTFIINKQLNYVKSKQLGYDKEHVLAFNIGGMYDHLGEVKTSLLQQPGVLDVTYAGGNIMDNGQQTGNSDWEGKENGETLMLSPMVVDKDFLSFFKMQLKEGAGFTGSVTDSAHYILNETAVKAARITDPIGKRFSLWGIEGTIIGVVKDFHFSSMKKKIQPAILYYRPAMYGKIYVRTTAKDAPKAIAAAEKKWKTWNAAYPFAYFFLDDTFNELYKTEQRTGILFNVFAIMAVFISCLGLFGLAAYTAQLRTKEIGLRKVLGASVTGITRLIAKDFMKLVLIAIVIALPLAKYIMNQWLHDFAYKANIHWTLFIAPGLIAIGIAGLTISFQAIKAAVANPIKSLRTE